MEPLVSVDVLITPEDRRTALFEEARAGLSATPKSIPPTWFYDDRGSQLFEEITRLEEYYPTRAERAILAAQAREIVEMTKATTLVELGSGTSDKTRLLLDAMAETGRLDCFAPFDVSEATLRSAAADISTHYAIPVLGVVGDFRRHLHAVARRDRRLVVFLGGTIGNFTPAERRRFLVDIEATMSHDDWLLLGTDLEKDPERLVKAYDDASGVTAEFNRNVLKVLNSELGADFEPANFRHVALWNADERWIEMRLRSSCEQVVHLEELALDVTFAAGEDLLTEISAKFTRARVEDELRAANFVPEGSWTDPAGDFLLSLAHPFC